MHPRNGRQSSSYIKCVIFSTPPFWLPVDSFSIKNFPHLPVLKVSSKKTALGQLMVYVSLPSLCITLSFTFVTSVIFLLTSSSIALNEASFYAMIMSGLTNSIFRMTILMNESSCLISVSISRKSSSSFWMPKELLKRSILGLSSDLFIRL